MAEEPGKEDQQEFSGEIAGQKFRVKAHRLIDFIVILILAGMCAIYYQGIEHKTDMKETQEKNLKIQEKQTEAYNEMNYILTLSPADREKLNLSMPYSLQQKVYRRQWDQK